MENLPFKTIICSGHLGIFLFFSRATSRDLCFFSRATFGELYCLWRNSVETQPGGGREYSRKNDKGKKLHFWAPWRRMAMGVAMGVAMWVSVMGNPQASLEWECLKFKVMVIYDD